MTSLSATSKRIPGSPRSRLAGGLFIATLLLASLLAWGGVQWAAADSSDNRILQVIDGDGKEHLIPLDQNGSYPFTTALGENVVTVVDGTASMESSDCPGHDCIDQGAIHTSAEMIVCMPHQLIVSIVEREER